MGTIGASSNGNMYLDFEYQGMQCREYTAVENTPKNLEMLNDTLRRIEGEISLGIFDYGMYFPKSEKAKIFAPGHKKMNGTVFGQYAETWYQNNKIAWKPSSQRDIRSTLDRHLLPYFKDKPVTEISKPMMKEFRTSLAQLDGRRKGRKMSNKRINNVMTVFRMIMNEAAEEHGFVNPFMNFKQLKVVKPDIMPLSLAEVFTFLENVHEKHHDYYVVRFFTGMRTAEIDGLQWKYVDFASKKIQVRETWENRQGVSPKTATSIRDIEMSIMVEEALLRQKAKTGNGHLVFTTRSGRPLDHDDMARRIWYPTLKKAGLAPRAPYQSRHTFATMMLASGENPEWVARQLGHSTTQMLFKVYSKFIPNLTRRDGSAFETFLNKQLITDKDNNDPQNEKDGNDEK